MKDPNGRLRGAVTLCVTSSPDKQGKNCSERASRSLQLLQWERRSPGWVSCSLSVAGHFPAGTLGSCLTELMGKSVRLATEDQTETEKHVEKQPGLRSLQDTLLLALGPHGESTQRLYPSAELSRAPCLLRVGSSAWLESQ